SQIWTPTIVQKPEPELESTLELQRQGVPLNRETQLVPVAGRDQLDDIFTAEETPDDGPETFDPPSTGRGAAGDGDDFTSATLGRASGLGTSIGVGAGGSRPGRGGPPGFRNRGTPGHRGTRGIPQGTEAAVLYGLTWLARHQMPDGSWDAVAYQD